MDERKEYQDKHKAELTQLNKDIGKLKALARRAKDDAKAGYDEQVKHLELKLDSALEKVEKLRESSEDAWDGLRSGTEKAMGELKAGVKEAWHSISAD